MVMRSLLTLLLAALATTGFRSVADERPNIVLILADDMGYGDPGCYNPDSGTPTPWIDRLASEGMRLTDAHAPASVCVPSRYGLMTGRYPVRANLKWREMAVLEKGRMTLASFLKENGYVTSMVGKWHLGFDGGPEYDFTKPLVGGPLDRGFDSYFGIPHSLDIVPYYYIRGRYAVEPPTSTIEASSSEGWSPIQGAFWRAGPIASGFKHIEVLPKFQQEAVAAVENYVRDHASSAPLFLYFALPAPHTPWLPTREYQGRGNAGMYSAFVSQVDETLGQVLEALERTGIEDNTLVIFTSDNGPVWYDTDVERLGHDSAGPLRGMKGDAWEAGHRVPFITRWPGQISPGSASDRLLCFTDLMATFAEIVGQELPSGAGEDSYSFLPSLLGREQVNRPEMVIKQDASVIRQGYWKLITHLGSGGFSTPRRLDPEPGGPKGQLYNLQRDLAETNNLWSEQPEVVQRLISALREYKSNQ